MGAPAFLDFELSFVVTTRPPLDDQTPELICHVRVMELPMRSRGSVTVIRVVDGQWQHLGGDVSVDALKSRVVAPLTASGIPGRQPHVEEVPDTSESFGHILVSVRSAGKASSFAIDMQASGFAGADADNLRRGLSSALELAGAEHWTLRAR